MVSPSKWVTTPQLHADRFGPRCSHPRSEARYLFKLKIKANCPDHTAAAHVCMSRDLNKPSWIGWNSPLTRGRTELDRLKLNERLPRLQHSFTPTSRRHAIMDYFTLWNPVGNGVGAAQCKGTQRSRIMVETYNSLTICWMAH